MNDKENEAAKQKLLEAMKSGMNAATFQQLEKVINNPGASGLDPKYLMISLALPKFPVVHSLPKSAMKTICTLPSM